MRPIVVMILLALVSTGCSSNTTSSDSGIVGQVFLGPTCPVETPGIDCADKPYRATLTVLTSSNKRVTSFETDQDGNFRINLLPGDYVLHPEMPPGQLLPFATDQAFIVQTGHFTILEVDYDTGIR